MVIDKAKVPESPPKVSPPSAVEATDFKKQAVENLAGWQRERANFENYKKEVARARADFAKLATLGFVEKLLPVLIDFERALEQPPPAADEAVKVWLNGVKQVHRHLREVLNQEGVVEISPAPGTPFNPHEHEAVATVETKKVAAGQIAALLEKGYRLHERLVRPARVAVAK